MPFVIILNYPVNIKTSLIYVPSGSPFILLFNTKDEDILSGLLDLKVSIFLSIYTLMLSILHRRGI